MFLLFMVLFFINVLYLVVCRGFLDEIGKSDQRIGDADGLNAIFGYIFGSRKPPTKTAAVFIWIMRILVFLSASGFVTLMLLVFNGDQ